MNEENNNQGLDFNSLLVGMLIGGAIGILFAPRGGSESREILRSNIDDFMNNTRNNIEKSTNEVLNKAEGALDNVKDKVTQVKDDISKRLEDSDLGEQIKNGMAKTVNKPNTKK
jgi:gas vesicle protein